MSHKLTRVIRGYHGVSHFFWASFPLLVSSGCRFEPTCSEYSVLAIEKYGVFRGLWKSLLRVVRCNPLTKPSVDLP